MKKHHAKLPTIPALSRCLTMAAICLLAVNFCARGFTFSYWYNIGPQPINEMEFNYGLVDTNFYGNPYTNAVGQFSGRVPTLAVDPSNSNHWLIGAAQGGVWETSDAGSTWNPRTDDQASMAMGAIAFAPGNPLLVYAGTGEANFRGDAYAGAGLLVSRDGGGNWQMLNTNFAKTSFSHIRVNPVNSSNLVAATARGGAGVGEESSGHGNVPGAPPRGVFVSTDGGANFTRALTGEATALEANAGNFNQQYAGLGEIYGDPANGIYRTTNCWQTYELIEGPWFADGISPTNMGRMALAGSPSDPNTFYVGIAEARTDYLAGYYGIWVTTNAWAPDPVWTELPFAPVVSDSVASPRFWYYFELLVDPADPAVLYMAEYNVWRYAAGGWTSLADYDNNFSLHSDNHVMAWVPGAGQTQQMLLGNDGGVFISDAGVSGTWTNLNAGLDITQFYKGAFAVTGQNVLALGGAQDNATSKYDGSTVWAAACGGDGADCAISAINPLHWAVSSESGVDPNTSLPTVSIYRTLDGARTHNGYIDFTGVAGDIWDALPPSQQFFVHFEKAPYNDNLLIVGTARIWRCNNFFSGIPVWVLQGSADVDTNGNWVPISALAFAPSDTNGLTYASGNEIGGWQITTNGGRSLRKFNPGASLPGRYISGLAFSPIDTSVLYVTFSGFDEDTPGQHGHLFKTTNAVASTPIWMNISPPADLPNNCLAVDPNDATNIYVGTDLGVWNSTDGGSTWTHYGPDSGMPNVAVFDLRFNSKSQVTAFTHGRGAYLLGATNLSYIVLPFNGLYASGIPGCPICPPDDLWLNPGDPAWLDVPLQGIVPVDTVDLTATLLPSAQITPITGMQDYGVVRGQGAPVTRSFQFIAGGGSGSSCGDTVQAVLQLQDQGGVDLGQISIPIRLGVPSHPLIEAFAEVPPPGLPSGWSSTATGTAVPWVTTTNQPSNLPGTAEDDTVQPTVNYTNVMSPKQAGIGESFLTSPPFSVATSQAQLYFLEAFSVSNTFDGTVLEIAIGTQPFQDIIQAGGSFVADGYNTNLTYPNPLGECAAWSGDSGGWLPVSVNLPPGVAGLTVQLRWRFASSSAQTNGDWHVDSVYITEPLCLPPVSNPVILNPALSGSFFTFAINTVAGRNYVVEYKSNLTDAAWQTYQVVSGDGSQHIISVPISLAAQRFYRFHLQ